MALEAPAQVLVTGGCGYIGARLVSALTKRGFQVVVWARTMPPDASAERRLLASARITNVDLSNATAMRALPPEHFAHVFHLAGKTDFMDTEHPYEDFLDNTVATINVLEFIRRCSPDSRLIFASSAHVYGESSVELITETMRVGPVSPYGVSKSCAELYVRLYARIYGLRTAVARLFPVFGPGLRRYVVFDFMRKLAVDPSHLRIQGDGSQVRDLNYIDNVIEGLTTIASGARFDGDIYNVASGTHVSIVELAASVAELMHVAPRLEFSGELGAGAIARWIPDISALEGLGYRHRMSLRDGLVRTVAWFESECKRENRP